MTAETTGMTADMAETAKLTPADVAYAQGVADGWADRKEGMMRRWQRRERCQHDDAYNEGHEVGWTVR